MDITDAKYDVMRDCSGENCLVPKIDEEICFLTSKSLPTITAPPQIGLTMSDQELHCLMATEKDALQRSGHVRLNFERNSEVIEHARLIWVEATATVSSYQHSRGG